ncbi:MAG: hypothetical protein GEU95_23200 [Rhizobiales bacterium]|nr:hypothetical protein [Hyphomicrobiales bacterium]
MSTEKFQRYARECLASAADAANHSQERSYLQLARTWAEAALQYEILRTTNPSSELSRQANNHRHQKIKLKTVVAPGIGVVVSAPPVLNATDHTVEHTCGRCDATLLHAEAGQVHNLIIRCTLCGSYNTTDS